MHAISILQPGGPEQLSLVDLPTPTLKPGEVLIQVAAAGLNRADLLQRQGHYPPPPGASPLPGLEVSGVITALGSGAEHDWTVGDQICALLPGGGYAEYAVADAGACLPVPPSLDLIDAAALPEAVFTVWANLFSSASGQETAARMVAGERLLVQGGTSGVGSMALQIASARGLRIATTAGSEDKCRAARALGAELAVDYHSDWAAAVQQWAAPDGIDGILDMVAGPYFAQHVDLLGTRGRLAQIATSHGSEVAVDLRKVMQKRLVLTGSTLRSRPAAAKRALRDELARELWPLVTGRRIHPVVHARFPLAEAAEAHRALEAGGHIGKLLLTL
jgi:NADPH2:quinone reductase